MLDVIHALFEDDAVPLAENDLEAKDAIRKRIYPQLYDRPYRYGSSGSQAAGSTGRWEMETETPVRSNETKPYIPPTPIEDLPGILAPPLN